MAKTGIVIFVVFAALIGSVLTQEKEVACEATKEKGCKNCDKEITSCLKFIASALKGLEPLREYNQSICKVVEVKGLSTIKFGGCACFKEMEGGKDGPCYSQMVEITFDRLEVGCQLHDNFATTGKILAEEAGAGMVKGGQKMLDAGKGAMSKMPGFGKRDADEDEYMNCKECMEDGFQIGDFASFSNAEQDSCNTFFINVSWTGIIVQLNMKLCFEDDIYEMTDVKVTQENWDGLRFMCTGCQVGAKLCCYITCHDIVQKFLGLCIVGFVEKGLADTLEDPKMGEQLTALNCGDPAYDD